MATIKKLILLTLTVLVMTGCEEKDLKGRGDIVNIDSCQYIVCDATGGRAYVHHNNCRFCKERRQKELEELLIKLKGK